jgi:uncharacterized protein (TIGR02597 family)
MPRFLPLYAALAVFVFTNLTFAQSVTTNPVGFDSVSVNQNTTRALSLPFNKPPAFAAAATTVNAGALTIQTTSAGWTASPGAGSFGPFASNPYLVRMVSGSAIGRTFRIASNTTDTLTLVTGSDMTGVANGDQYQIFASETLQTLFQGSPPTNPPPGINANVDPTLADNILIRGTSAWFTYFHDGTQWIRQGPGTPSNTTAATPDQGFLFVRRGGGTYTFTNLGSVPITNLKTDLPASKITSFGNQFPVTTMTLIGASPNGLNLDAQPGWNKNADPTLADNVLVRGASSWITYYYDPTPGVGGPTNGNPGSWVRQGPQTPDQNPAIGIGTSVVIVRRAGSSVTLNQTLPYTLP